VLNALQVVAEVFVRDLPFRENVFGLEEQPGGLFGPAFHGEKRRQVDIGNPAERVNAQSFGQQVDCSLIVVFRVSQRGKPDVGISETGIDRNGFLEVPGGPDIAVTLAIQFPPAQFEQAISRMCFRQVRINGQCLVERVLGNAKGFFR
jgi:hypothetical protein